MQATVTAQGPYEGRVCFSIFETGSTSLELDMFCPFVGLRYGLSWNLQEQGLLLSASDDHVNLLWVCCVVHVVMVCCFADYLYVGCQASSTGKLSKQAFNHLWKETWLFVQDQKSLDPKSIFTAHSAVVEVNCVSNDHPASHSSH